ncbi:hypothetical protein EV2_014670 [Malus domestica]
MQERDESVIINGEEEEEEEDDDDDDDDEDEEGDEGDEGDEEEEEGVEEDYVDSIVTGYELAILSFNLHDEVFHVMHLPGELQDFKHLAPLFSWNNSVAILTTTSSLDDEYYDQVLWVMSSSTTTATTKPAWVRQLISRSKAFAAGRLFVGVWKDQHILLTRKQTHEEETNDVVPPENLFVYDPRSETQRKILNHGEMNLFGIGVNYVESLIPV